MMRECPFCREAIHEAAIRCRHCHSMLIDVSAIPGVAKGGAEVREREVTYVVDKGIVAFLKCSAGVMALLLGIGAFFFGWDFTRGVREVEGAVKNAKDLAELQATELATWQDEMKKSKEDLKAAHAVTEQIGIILKQASDGKKEIDAQFKALLESRPAAISEEQVRALIAEALERFPKAFGAMSLENWSSATSSDLFLGPPRPSETTTKADPFEGIRRDAAYAARHLNDLFKLELGVPPIEAAPGRNAYWDGKTYHCPPEVEHLPDVTYHNITQAYIQSVVRFLYSGQAGSLQVSYADVFAAAIKQERGGIPEEEYWVIAPGGGEWLKDQTIPAKPPRTPLRSLEAPGTAYRNDSILGNDPQAAHMNAIYTGAYDRGGVHINSGIPSKAFYEVAVAVTTKTAERIWYEALKLLKPNATFADAAVATFQIAAASYGVGSREAQAVQKAWEGVGVISARASAGSAAQSAAPAATEGTQE